MIHIVSAAMMPTPGLTYTLLAITKSQMREEFQKLLKVHKEWKSYVGYPNTARLLSVLLEAHIPCSRDKATVKAGDVMLVMKLTYRLTNPHEKTENKHGNSINDYEFYLCIIE